MWRKTRAGAVRLSIAATRHSGYAVSQRIRKRIEEAFGWIKTVAGQEKTKFQAATASVGLHLSAAAYNLVRLPKSLSETG